MSVIRSVPGVRSLREIVKQARAIARARSRRSIRQQEIAERLGLNPTTFSDILSGRRPPPYEDADLWSTELALTPSEAAELRDAMAFELALHRLKSDPAPRERLRELVARLEHAGANVSDFRQRLREIRERAGDEQ